MHRLTPMIVAGILLGSAMSGDSPAEEGPYLGYARECADILIESGTDRYGDRHTPMLVSILDVDSRDCPQNPEALDEKYRVARRDRRSTAGSNLLTDQPLIRTLYRLSESTSDAKYAEAANAYIETVLDHLVDKKGLLWWGWHRHYDVFTDSFEGHAGNHHEIHAIQMIDWDKLWAIDLEATQREIEAIWKWHVCDKDTGEINRHDDGKRGCDFAMSGGSHLRAFAFLYCKTKQTLWLERARLLADYYWVRRNPKTDLFPERPNAGTDRFDGSAFVTAITGCHCRALLDAYRLTQDEAFKGYAVAYLKAYAHYGYDTATGKYWGALKLDGTPIPGPREPAGYAMYEPRGHLDLWEPYAAGYQFPIYTADAYLRAYELTEGPEFLITARRFADWIAEVPPGTIENKDTWYSAYTQGSGKQGTYAGKYGRAVSFLLNLHRATGEDRYLKQGQSLADEAVAKLRHKGLFRGHPAKPYYEAVDGVGYLLAAMLDLDEALK